MNLCLISFPLLWLMICSPFSARVLTEEITTTPEQILSSDLSINPNLICNYEIMKSYGFTGNSSPKNTPHKYCPSISDNCCTVEDAETSFTIWNTDTKFKIERYYQIYNYAVRYLFGYTAEGFLLARTYSVQPLLQCKQAANDYLSMNLNPQMTQHIMSVITKSIVQVSDIRRGFYCSICDARVQTNFRDFFATTNLKTFSDLYLSKDFCMTLVESTIEASFYMVSYVYRYLNNVVALMNCKTGAKEVPQLDLASFGSDDIKNCFFFKNKYFFFFCQKYCNQFKLVSVTPILDGDLLNLRQFVDFFVKYRLEAFEFPRNNLLADGVQYEENFLVDFYPEVLRDTVFYRAGAQQSVLLDQYDTVVTMIGGMDPIPSTVDSNFALTIFGNAFLIKSFLAVFLAIQSLF